MSETIDRYTVRRVFTPWPMNLLAAIDGELTVVQLPADFDASLAYVLNLLTEREQRVLLMRYADGMTLEATAKHFGVTRERIRQVEGKALRELRRHDMQRFLLLGVRACIRLGHADAPPTAADTSMTLAELDLTVRTHNCMLRAGVETVADILKMNANQLLRVRNLGKKSAEEIITKLETFGFDCGRLRGEGVQWQI